MALPPTRRKPGWSLTNQLRRIWNNWGASSDWLDIIESLLRIILYEDCYASQQLVEEESTILLDWAVLEGIWKALSSPPYWRYQLIKIFFYFGHGHHEPIGVRRVAVEDLVLSQEDNPRRHRSAREILYETAILRSCAQDNSPRSTAHCFIRRHAQLLSEANRITRLIRW